MLNDESALMILETLYVAPVLSKECEDIKGRYAVYQTFEYYEGMLRKQKRRSSKDNSRKEWG